MDSTVPKTDGVDTSMEIKENRNKEISEQKCDNGEKSDTGKIISRHKHDKEK